MQVSSSLASPPSANTPRRLILASGSAYRKELLQRLRLPFEVMSPDIDETSLPNETPVATALRLAQAKAQKIAEQNSPALVIGSDQVATLDDHQIGKPGNHVNALAQLQMMRGRSVCVSHCTMFNRHTSNKHQTTANRKHTNRSDLPRICLMQNSMRI